MNYLFLLISLIHISIWIIVVFSFLNTKAAYINLYYIIPIIYISHILPFHGLTELKKKISPNNYEKLFNYIKKRTIIAQLYDILLNFFKFSTFNPISPQGMLILGSISSGYTLKINKY
jgi:hypothetical protein